MYLTTPSVWHSSAGSIALIVYVDDTAISGDDSHDFTVLKHYLRAHFHMKDLGYLRYFFGIEVIALHRIYFYFNRVSH